ncbi:electron transport complex subunit E [Myxococcota bacterium]|nr:electron transport complex subunit E [Myxococcota bacterium]MBU1413131.1 electron transport complex subunit E [Myxococcota bacterium]PKN26079.1 MAG: electron transport complex subunit RsxE [Deltaproteobacteria bacterium HGW-Deltaproteobacteria-22]
MSKMRLFTDGFWRENPSMVLLLGMCPTLAVTTSAFNGLGMGMATLLVLLGSNIVISAIAGIIPKKVRIPSYIVVIATLVTMVDMFMAAYSPDLHSALGLFIPLIVVNCIILGRAEAFASRNRILPSILDALGMGLGFTLTLFVLGGVREILGNGTITIFEYKDFILRFLVFSPEAVSPILVMILAPGAFITLGFFIALKNYIDNARSV